VGLHHWVICSRHFEETLKAEPPDRPLKRKALRSLDPSGTDYPMVEPLIPKELDPVPHRENSGLARCFLFVKTVVFLILRTVTACEHARSLRHYM
jgi:hypothetical protein